MTDIPDWAGKRACELLNTDRGVSFYIWPSDGSLYSVITVAKLVMQHEQPPVDPDEEAVKRILAAFYGVSTMNFVPVQIAAAVSQYKQEKANG